MRRSTMLPLLTAASLACMSAPVAAVTLSNVLTIPNGTDLSAFTTVDQNRLGGFGSDLVFDAGAGIYYGMTDRGPGGGVLSYAPRIQSFTLTTDLTTGAISNFQLQKTIVFTRPDGSTFNGLNPTSLNGNSSVLGNSLDPEGLARLRNGHYLVSDEYGPAVYEFDANGVYQRAFSIPANILPTQTNGANNYTDGRPTISTGRQDNRGFEGLTVSPDGTTAYAVLQDPLLDDGSPDGRRSRNVRIVEFNIATGQPGRQLVYQLDDVARLNAEVDPDFAANDQGRSIGVSSIQALGNGKFLVLERDNRGLGTETSAANTPVSKRVYVIDTNGATDVSGIKLTANALPGSVVPVTKSATPYVDLVAALRGMGLPVPEKVEGLAFGERLADGGRTLLLITDNDFSVTQNGGTTQFDVCYAAGGATSQVPIGTGCANGSALLPTYLYSFRLSASEYASLLAAPAPEPASWAMMIGGFGIVGGVLRRRRAAEARLA